MSLISINLAEKKVLNHIRWGGSVFDPVGGELVLRFVLTALKDSGIYCPEKAR